MLLGWREEREEREERMLERVENAEDESEDDVRLELFFLCPGG